MVQYTCIYKLKGPKVIQQNLFPIDSNAFSCNLQGGQHAFLMSRVIKLKKTFFFAYTMD